MLLTDFLTKIELSVFTPIILFSTRIHKTIFIIAYLLVLFSLFPNATIFKFSTHFVLKFKTLFNFSVIYVRWLPLPIVILENTYSLLLTLSMTSSYLSSHQHLKLCLLRWEIHCSSQSTSLLVLLMFYFRCSAFSFCTCLYNELTCLPLHSPFFMIVVLQKFGIMIFIGTSGRCRLFNAMIAFTFRC